MKYSWKNRLVTCSESLNVESLNFKGKPGRSCVGHTRGKYTNEHRNAHLHTAPVFAANPYSKFKRILIGLFTPLFACCVDRIRREQVAAVR